MARGGEWGGRRLPDWLVAGLLLVFGILLTLPYSGPNVDWSPDGLFYEAQKQEVQGDDAETARREVFSSELAVPVKEAESDLPPRLRRIEDPEWVNYSAQFYRRRWTVPVMAAALDPIFGTRSLEEVSLIGLALLPPLFYLLLRRRFGPGVSAAASVFCAVLPPLLETANGPVTDSWGLVLLVAGLLVALLVRDRGVGWLPLWVAIVLVLSVTRDLTVVLVIAAGWLAFRERSRRTIALVVSGVIASIPAPLVFSAPLRDNLAYVLNDFRIPSDTSWSWIISHYPGQLSDLISADAKYPFNSTFPALFVLAMGVVVLAGLILVVVPRTNTDAYLSLIRAAAVGGIFTILISVNYTGLRLELVFLPAVATGVALLCERLLPRGRDAPVPEPAATSP